MKFGASLILPALLAGAPSAEQTVPTPQAQSVVVPSLPDQKNKEVTTRPGGALRTDAAGWVKNEPAEPTPKPVADPETAADKVAPGRGAPGFLPPPSPPSGRTPSGPAVVEAAYLTLRGVVKGYEKGISITIVGAGGRERKVPLAEKAAIYQGLKAGDRVVLTIPLGKPGDGKSAGKVEKEKPKAAPPKSKFAEAQTPAS